MSVRIHPTAIIEDDVKIGEGTSIWDNVHIRFGTEIGQQCIIGGKTYIAYEVQIGDRVKLNAGVYICHGVTLEDGVMVSAGTVFTNDRCPRATTPDLQNLLSSDPDEHTLLTRVRAGATIGANCTIGNDLTIGRFAMVGMGAVVTRSVSDFHLVVGNPARPVGCVCRCGQVLLRFRSDDATVPRREIQCTSCGLFFAVERRKVVELNLRHLSPAVATATAGDQA